jgi:hypothetical protein
MILLNRVFEKNIMEGIKNILMAGILTIYVLFA